MENQTVDVPFLKCFKDLFNKEHRYIIYYGGRFSGKSYHTALALLLRGRQERLRILCTREIQNTIKDSVHKLLKDLIDKFGFGDYRVTNDSIVNTITNTEFFFKGLKRNVTEIKSMEGVDICWIEEGQNITNESLDILTPTIRKEGSQIIITFNRFTELDPVYVRYVMNEPPKTLSKVVNYDQLEKEGLLTETIKQEIYFDKENNPELYAHKWLGQPISQNDNSAIPRANILEAMSREVTDDGQIEIGVDVARFGGDRTVLWKRKGLKTLGFQVYQNKRTTEVCDLVENFADFNKEVKIKVDDTGIGGGVTDDLVKRGYAVVPINFGGEPQDKDKYSNLISEAWFYFKEIIDGIGLPNDRDLLMELSTRLWKQDIKGRRCIESKQDYKKRGYRSPDLADACIICYYNPVKIEPNIRFI